MDFLEDDLLIIIPSTIREKVYSYLSEKKDLYNIKMTTFNEVKERLFFSFKEEVYLYLKEKYNYNYDVISKYLDNLYFLPLVSDNPKIEKLISLKEELIKENLLIYDDYYKYYLRNYKVLVWGFDVLSASENLIVEEISKYTKIDIILNSKGKYRPNKVYSFNYIDDEIIFVLDEISSLIEKGIHPLNIYLTNVNDEYLYPLKKYFSLYNIPLNIEDKSSLIEIPLTKFFLDNYENDVESTLNLIKDNFDLENNLNNKIYNKLINLLNKTSIYDKSYLKRLFSKTYINNTKYKNGINIVELEENIFTDEDYVFVLSFNQGIIPKIYQDEDYLDDSLKKELNLDTSTLKNKNSKEKVISSLSRIKNLVITYKDNSLTESYYPSNLIKELSLEVISCKPSLKNKSYSKDSLYLKLGMNLDNLLKYGTISPELSLYYSNLPHDYQTYNNKYKQIDPLKLRKYLNSKLVLSYSSINTFYKCSYRYYLDNILKINLIDETFYTMIGNLYHYVLSKIYKEDFDFNREVNNFLSKQDLTIKEKYFTNKLIEELSLIVKTILKQEEDVSLKKRLLEYKVEIDESDYEYNIKFKGFVDKVIYDEINDQTLVSVIDYKTGNVSGNINNLIYGLDMQLPSYLYLLKYSNVFSSVRYMGFYLQRLLHSEIVYDNKKSYLKQKEDSLRLLGYSNSDEEILELFDPYYQDSHFIKGMKKTENGFSRYSKVLNDNQINNLILLTKDNIKKASKEIVNANFKINPKRIDGINLGCEFCKYQDICFFKENDIVDLEKQDNLDYLN